MVNVPDILLQDAVPLIVYISYNPDGDIGTTEYAIRIPVMPSKRPSDYVYNPESGGSSGGSGGSGGGSVTVVNNLTTNDATIALSAAQGVVLKSLVDALDDDKVDTSDLSAAISKELNNAIANGDISGVQGEPGTPGKDGRGIVSITRTSGNGSAGSTDVYTIRYTDNTTSTFSVYNGVNGKDGVSTGGDAGEAGDDGATFIPYVDPSGNLSWTNDKGLPNPDTVNIRGSAGKDGISCTHSWSGTTLTVKSASGTSSAD